jgi:hypothetical protein
MYTGHVAIRAWRRAACVVATAAVGPRARGPRRRAIGELIRRPFTWRTELRGVLARLSWSSSWAATLYVVAPRVVSGNVSVAPPAIVTMVYLSIRAGITFTGLQTAVARRRAWGSASSGGPAADFVRAGVGVPAGIIDWRDSTGVRCPRSVRGRIGGGRPLLLLLAPLQVDFRSGDSMSRTSAVAERRGVGR